VSAGEGATLAPVEIGVGICGAGGACASNEICKSPHKFSEGIRNNEQKVLKRGNLQCMSKLRTFSRLLISEESKERVRGLLAMLWRWRSSSKSNVKSCAIASLCWN